MNIRAMYRRISTQSRLRRRGEEMSHGRSDSENSSKTRRCRGCTRGRPYHARSSRLDLGKFYFAEANSKAKMTKSRRKIAKLLPASAGAEPTVRFSARLDDTYRILEYSVRRVGFGARLSAAWRKKERRCEKDSWERGEGV